MGKELTIEEIEDFYRCSGYSTEAASAFLKRNTTSGYTESYDQSLLVMEFSKFVCVCGVGLDFIEKS